VSPSITRETDGKASCLPKAPAQGAFLNSDGFCERTEKPPFRKLSDEVYLMSSMRRPSWILVFLAAVENAGETLAPED
jgi:hypothetical protein